MDWAARIRDLRESRGLKQKDFAEFGECSVATIRAWEKGSRPITLPTFDLILRRLDSSLPKFFEAKIPDHYPDPAHQEIHENLQEILTSNGKLAEGIILNIEAIYRMLMQTRTRAASKRAGPSKMKSASGSRQ